MNVTGINLSFEANEDKVECQYWGAGNFQFSGHAN